jgi:CheY-like chemotaxis protein/MinD-like ATPase involved in chromosome partitioning or flagellar assembly
MADKILVVDDDPDTVKFINIMLSRLGYQVTSATSGMEALERVQTDHPDLIILDVMMPGMDGYEVSRNLRRNPKTATTPILMFTAKTTIEDKLAGYDAGVNLYLTKPIHPIDLQANIRNLLIQKLGKTEITAEKGYVVGVLAATGGAGVSTVALNLAITYAKKYNVKVIAAEMKPGQGSWALDLNLSEPVGLPNLLNMEVPEITMEAVSKELIQTNFGIKILSASNKTENVEYATEIPQLELVLEYLSNLASLVVLDIGTSFHPGFNSILNKCNELIMVVEPQPVPIKRSKLLASELHLMGFGSLKTMSTVLVNRTRSDIVLNISQVEQILGYPAVMGFPPVVEQAYRAAERAVPLTMVQPDGIIAMQFITLASQINERVPAH